MVRKKILILGGTSYIGIHLFNHLGKDLAIRTYHSKPVENGIYFDALSMDLSKILKNTKNISHAVILLGDANPDSCAGDIEKSKRLNVDSIKSIIDHLNEYGIKPVFTSSQFVFDGKKGDYTEEDPVSPILTYGKQKVEIERYIQKMCSDFIIARISKAFGSQIGDKTIFTNWLDDIDNKRDIHCSYDQILSPIYVKDIANSIISLINNNCSGIFHLSGKKAYSRLELFGILLNHIKKYSSAKPNVIKCSINDFSFKEKRPLNVSMRSNKLTNVTGIKLHDINEICEDIAKEYSRIKSDKK